MHFPRLPLHLPRGRSRGRRLLNIHLFEEDWQSAVYRIQLHPREARVWLTRPGFFDGVYDSRVLPIHVACSSRAPLEVVRAIVEAWPECLGKKESSYKRLPLHIACQFAAPVEVVSYLAQKHPMGTMSPDLLRRLPIHYACSNGLAVDVARALIREGPVSTLYRDHDGFLPLHVAVRFGASAEAIKEIIRACPAAVAMKTGRQSTTLQLAMKAKTKNRERIVKMLEDAMVPGSIHVRRLHHLSKVPKAARDSRRFQLLATLRIKTSL